MQYKQYWSMREALQLRLVAYRFQLICHLGLISHGIILFIPLNPGKSDKIVKD